METCLHYWVIEPPLGQYSRGTCRKCGELKRFTNYEVVPIFPRRQVRGQESTPKESA